MKRGHRTVYKFLQPALESRCRQLCLCNKNRPQCRVTGGRVPHEETFAADEVRGDIFPGAPEQVGGGCYVCVFCFFVVVFFRVSLLVEVPCRTDMSLRCVGAEGRDTSIFSLLSVTKRHGLKVSALSSPSMEDCKPAHVQYEASSHGPTWRRLGPTHGSHWPPTAWSAGRFACSRVGRCVSSQTFPPVLVQAPLSS